MATQYRTFALLLLVSGLGLTACGQFLPTTEGETLAGQRMILAEALRGQTTVLIMGFSRDSGTEGDHWAAALAADPALKDLPVYRAAMLEAAPGFVRSLVKSALRRQLSAAEQQHYVILERDESLWRNHFAVTSDKDPYLLLMDPGGKILWRGHGAAHDLEAQMRTCFIEKK